MSDGNGEKTVDAQHEQFKRGIIGFYVSCTVVGTAAAVAAVSFIVFGEEEGTSIVAPVACVVTVVASFLTWHFLRISRREV